MAYDPATRQLVLFGGGTGGLPASDRVFNDTWTWDGTTWTQQSPATSPPARQDASIAYDPGTGQLVLFGGFGEGSYFNDTWTWDGTTWTQQSPATSPPWRQGTSMVYDPGSGQLVLFGGYNLNDTWTWDGSTWTNQSPATRPPVLFAASMAYDAGTGQLVLFGGWEDLGPNVVLNDTWTWNGSTWTQQSPATSPPARFEATMVYDPGTGQLVLFGGYVRDSFFDDTWTWDGTTWTQQSTATSPAARFLASMAYDPDTGQLVIFGGQGVGGGDLIDTWNYGYIGGPPAETPEVPFVLLLALAGTSLMGGAVWLRRRSSTP